MAGPPKGNPHPAPVWVAVATVFAMVGGMPGTFLHRALPAVMLMLAPNLALAAEPSEPIGLLWGLPFAGLLLSIALGPLLAERLWHKRMGLIAGGWGLALLLPWMVAIGELQLTQHAAHVRLDGLDRDEQLSCDLFVRVAAGDQPEYLTLPLGESIQIFINRGKIN